MVLYFYFFPGFESNQNVQEDQEYYGAIDSIESVDEENSQIIFDSVKSDSFNSLVSPNMWETEEQITPHILFGTIENSYIDRLKKEVRSNLIDGRWFKIKTTKKETDFPISLSVEDSEIPEITRTYIHSIEYLKKEDSVSIALSNFFSFSGFQKSNQKKIEDHLKDVFTRRSTHKHNVFNVGQGSLTVVTGENNVPLFYFDLGGAWWIFPSNYTPTLKLCSSHTKTVIISHWDMDHLETARRLFYRKPNPISGFTWIAPEQDLTPMYARLAKRMVSTGNLLLWSGKGNDRIDFWAGSLLKCNGPDKNNSGIALLVNSPDNSIKQVLNPADANFKYIPHLTDMKLDGLVATHHGANFDFHNVPQSVVKEGALAYSHGNKYGHPTQNARISYNNAGWILDNETPNGHISFAKKSEVNSVPCGGLSCDLSIVQWY